MKSTFKLLLSLALLGQFSACSSRKEFVKEQVCSPSALAYVKTAKNRSTRPALGEDLKRELALTQKSIQQCYDDFLTRTGKDEFRTCLIVGVDEIGRMEYYNFSSQDIHSDQAFIQCAVKVTKRIPYWKFGSNYILMQTYNFYAK